MISASNSHTWQNLFFPINLGVRLRAASRISKPGIFSASLQNWFWKGCHSLSRATQREILTRFDILFFCHHCCLDMQENPRNADKNPISNILYVFEHCQKSALVGPTLPILPYLSTLILRDWWTIEIIRMDVAPLNLNSGIIVWWSPFEDFFGRIDIHRKMDENGWTWNILPESAQHRTTKTFHAEETGHSCGYLSKILLFRSFCPGAVFTWGKNLCTTAATQP